MVGTPSDGPSQVGTRKLQPGATVSDILRSFESLRRELAKQTRGVEGAFAGYDSLELRHDALDPDSELIVSAAVVSGSEATQTVRFSAYEDVTSCQRSSGSVCVADGVGRTVALARPVRPRG